MEQNVCNPQKTAKVVFHGCSICSTGTISVAYQGDAFDWFFEMKSVMIELPPPLYKGIFF